jgi:uncharacterized protein DUF3631
MSSPRLEALRQGLSCGKSDCGCQRPAGNLHCPAHSDHAPSLTATLDSGKLLVHCHAGCSQEAVVDALKQRGLWQEGRRKPGEPRLALVRFRDAEDSRPEAQQLTWSEFVALLSHHQERSTKDGAAWSPAVYRPNSRRGNRNVRNLTAAVGDFDDGTPWAAVKARLQGLAYVAHSTYSHTVGHPKFRVVAPFSRSVSPDEWPSIRRRVEAHLFADKADPATKDAARLYYLPSCPPEGDRFAESQEGRFLDPDSLPGKGGPLEDTAVLLDEVAGFVTRFVVVPAEVLDALALWVLHTHAFEAASMTPYLHVTSPEKQSGKTRLLEVCSLLVPRPWHVTRVSVAALCRRIDKECPTLLLDESDASFNRESEFGEALRQVLNDGYRLNGRSTVVVGQGAGMTTQDFSVFCPKVIAGLREIPDTIADRSIRIEMKRRAPNESVEKFRERKAGQEAAPFRERLERWAAQHVDELENAEPTVPDDLGDRASDIWEPLLAIADLAGEEWSERARRSALSLSARHQGSDASLGVRLLSDIRAVLKQRALDRVASAELVALLVGLEESPWGDLRGKPLDARGLAWRLKPYGVKPKNVRFTDGGQAKGYETGDFEDAWQRYLPKHPSQPSQESRDPEFNSPVGTAGTLGTASGSTLAGDGKGDPVACRDCGAVIPGSGTHCASCGAKRNRLVAYALELGARQVCWKCGGAQGCSEDCSSCSPVNRVEERRGVLHE